MQCFNANGDMTLSTLDTVTRIVHWDVAAAGASGSVDLPDIDGKPTFHFALQMSESTWPHSVTRNGTTISWSPINNGDLSSGNSVIIVMLYS